jgi:hypothetical protein
LDHYVNPNFFSHPVGVANNNDPLARGFGTPMRNIYRGPFQQDVDFSVTKAFHITGKHHILFRYDFFNHPHFTNPGTDSTRVGNLISSAQVGVITSTATQPDGTTSERQLQVALKLSF